MIEQKKWDKQQTYFQLQGIFISALFILGILLPTQVNQWMKLDLIYLAFAFLLFLLLFIISKKSKRSIISGILLNGLLWVFTFLSPLRFSRGECIYYVFLFLTVTLLFQIKLVDSKQKRALFFQKMLFVFQCISWIILFGGYSIVSRFQPVTNFLINHYNYFYDGLVESMIFQEKPVVMFGSHSLAGFYLFLFFILNGYVYFKMHNELNAGAAIGFLGLLFFLKSTSGYLFLLLGLLFTLGYLFTVHRMLSVLLTLILLVIGGYYSFHSGMLTRLWLNLTSSHTGNGFGARYLKGGTVYPQVQRILKNPLIGSGTRSIDGTFYIDSGPVHIGQRIGIEGIVLFYGLFLNFLKRNGNKRFVLIFFLGFFMFEFGLANLLYFRTIFILLFIIYFVQYLQKIDFSKQGEKK